MTMSDVPPVEPPSATSSSHPGNRRVRGAALLAAIVILVLGVGWYHANSELDSANHELARYHAADAAAAQVPDLRLLVHQEDLVAFASSALSSDALSLHFNATSPDTNAKLSRLLADLGFNADAVMARIAHTRALDGTLSERSAHVNMTWTYHPDHGLDIVFEVNG